MNILLEKAIKVHDYQTHEYEIEIIDLRHGKKRTLNIKADNKENAMQIAVEGHAQWMIGMTTSTLRDFYIETRNILVKEPNPIS